MSEAVRQGVPLKPSSIGRLRRLAMRRLGLLGLAPALLLMGIAFLYPVLTVLVRSVTEPELGLSNYEWLFANESALRILTRTLFVASLVTGICLIVGYPYAFAMLKAGPKFRVVLLVAVLMPFWTSLMVRTFSWVVILQNNGVLNAILGGVGLPATRLLGSLTAVLIAGCQVLLPFMVLPLYTGMLTIDRRLTEASQICGADPRKTFARIFVPLSLPGVIAGSAMVFLLTLGFYIIPALVGSPNQELLPNAIYNQVSTLLDWGRAGAMAMSLLATMALLLLLVAVARRKVRGVTTRVPGRLT